MDRPPFPITSIMGAQVFTDANEAIGEVVDIFLDADDLEVAYFLISVQLAALDQERRYIIHSIYFTLADTPPYLRLSTALQYGMLDKLPQLIPSLYQDIELGSYRDFRQQIVPLLSVAGHQSDG